MTLFATYDKSQIPWRRRTGIYGHLPKFWKPKNYWRPVMSYCGYLCVLTKKHRVYVWFMGNPTTRGKFPTNLIEVLERHEIEPWGYQRPDGTVVMYKRDGSLPNR